jgi:hypothetical protein
VKPSASSPLTRNERILGSSSMTRMRMAAVGEHNRDYLEMTGP